MEVNTQKVSQGYGQSPEADPSSVQTEVSSQANTAQSGKLLDPASMQKQVDAVLTNSDAVGSEEVQGLYKKQDKNNTQPKPTLGSTRHQSGGATGGTIGGFSWDEIGDMSIGQLMALAQNASMKASQGKAETAGRTLDMQAARVDQQNAENVKNVEDYVKKQADVAAQENSPGSWILAIFGFIAALIAAVVAVVAAPITGGVSLVVAGAAIMGAVAAGVSLVSKISTALGGPSFGMGSIVAVFLSKIFVALGMDQEKADEIANLINAPLALISSPFDQSGIQGLLHAVGKLAGQSEDEINAWLGKVMIAISVIMGIAMIAFGLMSGGGGAASQLSNMLTKLSPELINLADKAFKLAKVAFQVGSIANDVRKGVLNAHVLEQRAIVDEGQALLKLIQANKDLADDSLKKAMQSLQAAANSWSKVIQDNADASQKISRSSRA